MVDDENKLTVSMLDGSICTHIIVGFASIDEKTLTLIPSRPEDVYVYQELSDWRRIMHPNLKIMLSVGGGSNTKGFHESCLSYESRSRLIQSILTIIERYDFDGLDIDWEFPAWSQFDVDRDNFGSLLRELRSVFLKTLSVAVSASETIISVSYNASVLKETVDFVNLMSYDFHDYSPLFPFVEFNAPLFRRSKEDGLLSTLNVNWSAFYWTSLGMPKNKIVVGIPSYSHNYKLLSNESVRVGSPALREEEEFTYSQVCHFLSSLDTAYIFEEEAKVPYAFNRQLLWSSFEDVKSVSLKAKYIRDYAFKGAMLFDLNCDDFVFKCSLRKRFVLQSIISDILT